MEAREKRVADERLAEAAEKTQAVRHKAGQAKQIKGKLAAVSLDDLPDVEQARTLMRERAQEQQRRKDKS